MDAEVTQAPISVVESDESASADHITPEAQATDKADGQTPESESAPVKVTLHGREFTEDELERIYDGLYQENQELKSRTGQSAPDRTRDGEQPSWEEELEAACDELGVGYNRHTKQRLTDEESLMARDQIKNLIAVQSRFAERISRQSTERRIQQETYPQRVYNAYMNDPSTEGFRTQADVATFVALHRTGWAPDEILQLFRDRETEKQKQAGVTQLNEKRKALEPPSSGGSPPRKPEEAEKRGRQQFLDKYLFG